MRHGAPLRQRFFTMKSDSIAFGIAGMVFGLLAGWVIGSQQAASVHHRRRRLRPRTQSAPANPPLACILDEAKATAFKNIADKEPSNSEARIQLANLYFDAERYDDAIKWYQAALKLKPKDVNVSTDLGVCYYSTNQPDKALEQFDQSLKIDPNHAKIAPERRHREGIREAGSRRRACRLGAGRAGRARQP